VGAALGSRTTSRKAPRIDAFVFVGMAGASSRTGKEGRAIRRVCVAGLVRSRCVLLMHRGGSTEDDARAHALRADRVAKGRHLKPVSLRSCWEVQGGHGCRRSASESGAQAQTAVIPCKKKERPFRRVSRLSHQRAALSLWRRERHNAQPPSTAHESARTKHPYVTPDWKVKAFQQRGLRERHRKSQDHAC